MNPMLWITTLTFFLLTSYYFNRQKIMSTTKIVLLRSGLEGITTFLFVMMFVVWLSNSDVGYITLFFILFLVVSLILFWQSKVRSNAFDLEIETLKNNVVVFLTTLVPFILFWTMFKGSAWYFQYLVPIIFTGVVFISSQYIKTFVSPFYEKITIRIQLTTDLTLYIVGIVILSIISITSIILLINVVNPFNSFEGDINNYITVNYYNETKLMDDSRIYYIFGTVNDFYSDNEYFYVFHTDGVSNDKVLTIRKNTTGEVILKDSTFTDEKKRNLSNVDLFLMINDQLTFTPSRGAYIVNLDGLSLINTTENYESTLVNIDGEQHILVDKSYKNYSILDSDFNPIDLIYTTPLGIDLSVVDGELFTKDINYYFHYSSGEIAFENNDFNYSETFLNRINLNINYDYYEYIISIFMFVALFVPYSNYRKHETVVEFKKVFDYK